MFKRWTVVVAVVAALAWCRSRAADEPPLVSVAFLAELESAEPARTSADDNFVYRLVHRLIPDDRTGPPPPADIASPGPDTATFPNVPFTVPKGRSYIESVPGTFSLAGADGTPATWSWPFMMRTGLTEACEFRVISQGPTVVEASPTDPAIDGFAPLIFGLKMHLWGQEDRLWWPSVGVQTFLVTGIASRPFNLGTEPGIVLLVNHVLPEDVQLTWNVGYYGSGGEALEKSLSLPTLGAQWAVQKQLTSRFAAFVQGFYGNAGIPIVPSDVVVGLGGQWNPTQRLALYTSYNWSVDGIGSPSGGISGFAYAY